MLTSIVITSETEKISCPSLPQEPPQRELIVQDDLNSMNEWDSKYVPCSSGYSSLSFPLPPECGF